MTYSLKVDWSRERIEAVDAALRRRTGAVSQATQRQIRAALGLEDLLDEAGRAELEEYGATIKADLTERQLDDLELVLGAGLPAVTKEIIRAREKGAPCDELVALSAQTHEALRDVIEYRWSVAKVRQMAKQEN